MLIFLLIVFAICMVKKNQNNKALFRKQLKSIRAEIESYNFERAVNSPYTPRASVTLPKDTPDNLLQFRR